jgi:ATP-dependent 26S proteasome regulatory subunit
MMNGQYFQQDNIGSMIKQMMMTSFIFKNVNGTPNLNSGQTDYMSFIYIFIVTQIIEAISKYIPELCRTVIKNAYSNIHTKVENISSPIKMQKSASIIININMLDIENTLGKSIMDYITNNKNTKNMYYLKQQFVLNQMDELLIDNDIYVCMLKNGIDIESPQIDSEKNTTQTMNQVIEIFSYTKSSTEVRYFLKSIQHNYIINTQNRLGTQRFYFNMHNLQTPLIMDQKSKSSKEPTYIKDLSRLPNHFVFGMKPFETNRSFINLFGEEIDIIKKRVQFFINNKKWYDEKGIPYTLGLMLSGDPGTGKTSTIKCLANETNRHIININFNNDITKRQLENLFFNEDIVVINQQTSQNEKSSIPLNQRIYVLEDVDCQGDLVLERSIKKSNDSNDNNTSNEAVDLSFLLNLLDGVLETPGRIVIMTTNRPDILDKALIRPGRVDVIAEFKKCTNNTLIQMLEFFYDKKLTEQQNNMINNLHERIITPAEMSKVMFENFYNIDKSIEILIDISRKSEDIISSMNTNNQLKCEVQLDKRENVNNNENVLDGSKKHSEITKKDEMIENIDFVLIENKNASNTDLNLENQTTYDSFTFNNDSIGYANLSYDNRVPSGVSLYTDLYNKPLTPLF